MTQYGFFFDQTRCYGCQACATACKDWNNLEPGPEKWMCVYEWETGAFPSMHIHELAFSCGHCDNPACVPACPEGAIFMEDEYGAVLVDQDKCVGCRSCAEACPYGAPKFASEDLGAKMSKCTMCIDRLAAGDLPQCVLACPIRAFDFGPMDEMVAKYGNVRRIEGMPESGVVVNEVFKPLQPKQSVIPLDVDRLMELQKRRGTLPDTFEDVSDVTEIPEGVRFRDSLHMKNLTAEEVMRATRNDLG